MLTEKSNKKALQTDGWEGWEEGNGKKSFMDCRTAPFEISNCCSKLKKSFKQFIFKLYCQTCQCFWHFQKYPAEGVSRTLSD